MVDDEKVEPCKSGDHLIGAVICQGCIKFCKESLEVMELDFKACLTCLDAQGGSDVAFACAGFRYNKWGQVCS
jgi:hypothetical protein